MPGGPVPAMVSTTPSVTGVQVIGDANDDYALNVGFDDGELRSVRSFIVVAFVDVNAGQIAVVGDKLLGTCAGRSLDRNARLIRSPMLPAPSVQAILSGSVSAGLLY